MADGGFPEVLGTKQASELLMLNVNYIRRLAGEGVLPGRQSMKERGQPWRFDRDEILDWLRKQPTCGASSPEDQDPLR